MDSKDVIISAFACGGKMNCAQEAAKFKDPPVVLTVPGGSSSGFVATANQHRRQNSILNSFLKSVKPRRVCLLSFSAGWAWSTEVLKATLDLPRIDTVMVMDGIHTPNLAPWFEFAKRAGKGGSNNPKLWMAHTQIKPPFVSSKITNQKITDFAKQNSPEGLDNLITAPEYITFAQLQEPISIFSNIENPKTKVFQKDTLVEFEQVGNVVRFEYEGSRAQDHIYNAQYVQPRFWEWLRNIWDDVDEGIRYE